MKMIEFSLNAKFDVNRCIYMNLTNSSASLAKRQEKRKDKLVWILSRTESSNPHIQISPINTLRLPCFICNLLFLFCACLMLNNPPLL